MRRIAIAATLAALAVSPLANAKETSQSVQAAADTTGQAEFKKGDMIYTSTGHRLASVYRVTPEGNAQVILQRRMVTVPASILSQVDGKLVADVANSRELLEGK